MSRSQTHFYQDLAPFQHFNDVMNDDHYQNTPKDWYVAIADIAGSTAAIEVGRYKDINVIGASAIMAVINACGSENMAYVFGGDGASFVFPPADKDKVMQALLQTQIMAQQSFGLYLRVGFVPVSDIYNANITLNVGKYQLAGNTHIAMFRGGGLAYADQQIKERKDLQLQADADIAYEASFQGLECRWDPMASKKGEMLTLMVQSRGEAHIYANVLNKIDDIYQKDEGKAPISEEGMSLTLSWQKLSQEFKIRTNGLGVFAKARYGLSLLMQTVVGRVVFAFDLHIFGLDGRNMLSNIVSHTDYQKFDDTLRMIIDGSAEMHDALETYLQKAYEDGALYYGLERSDSALMTCLILDRQDNHIHFVDGAGGGYTYAAKKMKQQMQAENTLETKLA